MGPVLGGKGRTHPQNEGWGCYPSQHACQYELELYPVAILWGRVLCCKRLCALNEVTEGETGLRAGREQVQVGR